MLLRQATLQEIRSGSISLAFRRWRRPNVKAGGTLLTSIGLLAIEAVDAVEPEDITLEEALSAGFPDLESLRSELGRRREGTVFRVQLSLLGPDPRKALRAEIPKGQALAELLGALARLGMRRQTGWPAEVLRVIDAGPSLRAAELAPKVRMSRDEFKRNVRRLKGLGLTESLEVGYRLSPRGEAVLRHLQDEESSPPLS